jgi:hypothetical protein
MLRAWGNGHTLPLPLLLSSKPNENGIKAMEENMVVLWYCRAEFRSGNVGFHFESQNRTNWSSNYRQHPGLPIQGQSLCSGSLVGRNHPELCPMWAGAELPRPGTCSSLLRRSSKAPSQDRVRKEVKSLESCLPHSFLVANEVKVRSLLTLPPQYSSLCWSVPEQLCVCIEHGTCHFGPVPLKVLHS